MTEAVGAIGGAQAQVMSAAEMQICVRARCTVKDVRDALWKDRTLVKTWLMRGTLHLIPAEDLPLYASAMGAIKPRNSVLKYLRMTERELHKLIETIGGALSGTPVTREELIGIAGKGQAEHVREWLRSGWGGLLKPVARRGMLSFGPSRGTSVTFVRPEIWLGSWRVVDRDAALVEIARRYLRAFGPATRSDFVRWFGPSFPAIGKTAWAGLTNDLVGVSVEGIRLEALASDVPALARTRRRSAVQLLPVFDPYLMGHASRDHLFERRYAPRVSRVAGWISAVVLVDGRVEGTWTHAIANGHLRVTIDPFRPLSSDVTTEIGRRAGSLARALGLASADVVATRGRASPPPRRGATG